MQHLKVLALFILCFYVSIADAQEIDWQENRPLTWEDFQGRPGPQAGSVAMSFSNISYTYEWQLKDSVYLITFKLRNYFRKDVAWVKGIGAGDYVLEHEQLHFDICELFTRRLAIAFRSAKYTRDFDAEIKAIFSKIWTEYREMQAKYDKETAHSNNVNMQYRWKLYIYTLLRDTPRNY